jgi:hypothetical protein
MRGSISSGRSRRALEGAFMKQTAVVTYAQTFLLNGGLLSAVHAITIHYQAQPTRRNRRPERRALAVNSKWRNDKPIVHAIQLKKPPRLSGGLFTMLMFM